MLRELNLYPLWQLRTSATAVEPATQSPEISPAVVVEKSAHADLRKPVAPSNPSDLGKSAQIDSSNMSCAELKKCVKACAACSLRAGCTQTVFGMGAETSDWLFVGSWPSEDDDQQGQPFAGEAGKLLDNMLAAIKLKRGENVYLANVVKCTGSITRGPQASQIAQCAPYLTRQIQLIQPKMIVVLGHAAATSMLGEDREWQSLLGKVHEYRGLEKDNPHAPIPLIITHHPAALLLTPLHKAQTWRDLCLARDTMQKLVSG